MAVCCLAITCFNFIGGAQQFMEMRNFWIVLAIHYSGYHPQTSVTGVKHRPLRIVFELGEGGGGGGSG